MSTNTLFTSGIETFARDISYLRAIRYTRNQRSAAIQTALKLVNNRHVTFNSLGFDQEFLQNEAIDLIEPFLYGGSVPMAETLATAWAAHFHFGQTAEREIASRVLPMMADFVYLLERSVEEFPISREVGESAVLSNFVLQP